MKATVEFKTNDTEAQSETVMASLNYLLKNKITKVFKADRAAKLAEAAITLELDEK